MLFIDIEISCIDALKDNIREAIGKIQLHTIDNVHKNWTDRVGYRSCDSTALDYYLWGVVKDKCYTDKPETIDVLKDNIREAFGKKYSCTQSIMCIKIGPIV